MTPVFTEYVCEYLQNNPLHKNVVYLPLCWSVLQHVAACAVFSRLVQCCSILQNFVGLPAATPARLQHTVTHCDTLQHTATQRNALHHTATHCNTLQYTAPLCNTTQRTATRCQPTDFTRIVLFVISNPSMPHCITPQHTTMHCNTLQYIATH